MRDKWSDSKRNWDMILASRSSIIHSFPHSMITVINAVILIRLHIRNSYLLLYWAPDQLLMNWIGLNSTHLLLWLLPERKRDATFETLLEFDGRQSAVSPARTAVALVVDLGHTFVSTQVDAGRYCSLVPHCRLLDLIRRDGQVEQLSRRQRPRQRGQLVGFLIGELILGQRVRVFARSGLGVVSLDAFPITQPRG